MTVLAFREFGGEIPKLRATDLPDTCAQYSAYVDHTKKHLSPLVQLGTGTPLTNTGGAVRSVYTEDGTTWFSWTSETYAFKGPVINDQFNRVYYLTTGGNLRVASAPQSSGSPNGGSPSTSYRTGVPRPETAPTLTLVARTSLPDYAAAAFEFRGWWEANGVRTDATSLSFTQTTWMERYAVTAPTNTGDDTAVFVVEATLKADQQKLFTLNTTASAAMAPRSQALPGGIEMALEKTGATSYDVVFRWGVVETRAYTYTVTNTYNEESQPAPAKLVSPTYLQDVHVTVAIPSFTDYCPQSSVNIYRTFGSGSKYLKITYSNVSANVYRDTMSGSSQPGEELKTSLWSAPPTSLAILEYASNGWFAAVKGNTLYMSEPFRPYAWPYNMAFSTNIRGVKAGAQGLVVTTVDGCYLVLGAHPAAVSQTKLPVPQGGISSRTMAVIDGAVVFASPDGLVVVQGSQATLKPSHQLFNRSDWQSRFPNPSLDATWQFASFDGRLLAVSLDGTKGFMLSLDEGDGPSTFTRFPTYISMVYYVAAIDQLMVATNSTDVYPFARGTGRNSATWSSKEFTLPAPTKFAALKIRAAAGSAFTFALYANSGLVHSQSITPTGSAQYIRLPALAPADRYAIEFSGLQVDVYEVYLGTSFRELKSV